MLEKEIEGQNTEKVELQQLYEEARRGWLAASYTCLCFRTRSHVSRKDIEDLSADLVEIRALLANAYRQIDQLQAQIGQQE